MAPKRPKRLYSCNACSNTYTQPQNVTRHYREAHERRLCLYCDFKSSRSYKYREHLKKHHPDVNPDVVLARANSTRRLCMYCDFEWNHPIEYKSHVRKRHPNVDPDAVLGQPPGSQRRDKIIARYYNVGGRKTAARFTEFSGESGDEARRDDSDE